MGSRCEASRSGVEELGPYHLRIKISTIAATYKSATRPNITFSLIITPSRSARFTIHEITPATFHGFRAANSNHPRGESSACRSRPIDVRPNWLEYKA